ncbi:MAG: hypothetical protein JOZ03_07530 [Gammaproteobacteria bacterium]|nr:hypothetical protein [Gammaproteobacteria bacterium]
MHRGIWAGISATGLLLALAAAAALQPPRPAPPVLIIAGARVQLQYDPGQFRDAGALREWVLRSGQIVAAYYGQFPVRDLVLRLSAVSGGGVQGGQTFANPDAFIRVRVGREVTAEQLESDWVLVHEMTHLALPDVGESHAWLSEGLAVYVEGVARVQAGNRGEADMWGEELRAMPKGMPQREDQGLDHTHTWARTYWGGAMFCLVADVAIRERTHNARGLQQALRAILRASGGLSADWPIERVLHTGDAAVGADVLEALYARWKDTPVGADLPSLWHSLGVEAADGTVRLDERAPLAPVRRAILSADPSVGREQPGERRAGDDDAEQQYVLGAH